MEIKNAPLVSVVIVCYNTGKYVLESLDSVLRQNYENIELFIVDDCSTDGISATLIKNWLEENQNLPFKIDVNFRNLNKGLHFNLNEILEKANGKYLCLNGDDLWTDDKISYQVNKLEDLGDEYAIYYGDISVIDKNSQILDDEVKHFAFKENFILPTDNAFEKSIEVFFFWLQSATIRLDLLKKIDYKFEKKYISEDWHLIISMARNYRIIGEKRIFGFYRLLENSVSRTLWTEDNMHNIYFSQFDMIFSFLHHDKNSSLDNLAVTKKLLNLLLGINCHNSQIRFTLLKKYLLLFSKSKNKRFLIERFPKILKSFIN